MTPKHLLYPATVYTYDVELLTSSAAESID